MHSTYKNITLLNSVIFFSDYKEALYKYHENFKLDVVDVTTILLTELEEKDKLAQQTAQSNQNDVSVDLENSIGKENVDSEKTTNHTISNLNYI